jgi:hypothetical protein
MLKARIGGTLIFGLSRVNIERLQEGKPIYVEGAEVGAPLQRFVIFFGETEDAMKAEIESLFHEKH